jgi:hypothetical protein
MFINEEIIVNKTTFSQEAFDIHLTSFFILQNKSTFSLPGLLYQ